MATVRFFGGSSGTGGSRGDGAGERRQQPRGRTTVRQTPAPGPVAPSREGRGAVELPAIPDKIYFRIGEVAHLVGVEPHVLRYWEHEFRSIRPTKSQRGQRVYSRRDVDHLRRIRGLLYEEGFTIAGAKKALRARGLEPREENDPAIVMSARAREALTEIRNECEAFLRELGG
jgi:DNA-binding transcriptional MerR regulator